MMVLQKTLNLPAKEHRSGNVFLFFLMLLQTIVIKHGFKIVTATASMLSKNILWFFRPLNHGIILWKTMDFKIYIIT